MVMVEDARAEALAADASPQEAQRRVDDWLNEVPLSEVTDPKTRILRLMGVA